MTFCGCLFSRSLLALKRTCRFASHRSANDPKRTSRVRAFFLSFRAYIRFVDAIGPHFCGRSSFNQHRNKKGLRRNGRAEKEMIVTNNSKEALKKRADARFKKDERAREGTKAMLAYEAEGRAVREKTARLRALRLRKEEAEKSEGVAADSGQPLVARKKASHGC